MLDVLEELVARERIKDVKARYCRLLDTKDGRAALIETARCGTRAPRRSRR
jgi:hypothetical protein